MAEPSIEKSFCTTREAATLLGVSVGTVQLWVESGLLQAWKTAGGHRRVIRASVEGLLHKAPVQAQSNLVAVTALQALCVMVVDDDPSMLRLYEANMSRWPMVPEVLVVDSAISALLIMGHKRPDLLVLDLNMPGVDGFKMLRTLRASGEVGETTIVVVSGLDSAEIEARGGVPSGVEVLPKPVPFARLLAIATQVNQLRLRRLPGRSSEQK
jgi:excisionase family DNA binding protein